MHFSEKKKLVYFFPVLHIYMLAIPVLLVIILETKGFKVKSHLFLDMTSKLPHPQVIFYQHCKILKRFFT